MADGWIKLHRELTKKSIWQCSKPEQKVVLITLLIMANHSKQDWEWQGKRFICGKGQFITSLDSIALRAGKGVSVQMVRTSLKRFKEYGFLTNESTKTGRLITIINWDTYQSAAEKSTNDLADDQQTANKQPTANKNEKNVKNVRKKKPPLTEDELLIYFQDKLSTEKYDKFKDLLIEFFNYRMTKKKDSRYKTKRGINGLFRNLKECNKIGISTQDALEITMERNWLTPDPEYFPDNIKTGKKHTTLTGEPEPKTYAQCQDAEGRQQVALIKKLRAERLENDNTKKIA